MSVEVLKPRSLLIKLSPRTRGPKNYSGLRVLTSYFYFYICFCAATTVVNGGSIFGIWMVGEEIWVRFFWAKGLRGSWFLFFSWKGGGGGGGVLGVLIGGSELEWEMRRIGWGGSTGCIMHRVTTSWHKQLCGKFLLLAKGGDQPFLLGAKFGTCWRVLGNVLLQNQWLL
jgi:hypothetical protein